MSDRIKSKKIPDWANRANTSAARLDPGPYIGIVKNNFDNTRSGRLQVWIPDLGGEYWQRSYSYICRRLRR